MKSNTRRRCLLSAKPNLTESFERAAEWHVEKDASLRRRLQASARRRSIRALGARL